MTGEHCTEFYFPTGADCYPCKNRDKKIKELEDRLVRVQDYITFKTSTFPKSMAVGSEYVLAVDIKEMAKWFIGLEEVLE